METDVEPATTVLACRDETLATGFLAAAAAAGVAVRRAHRLAEVRAWWSDATEVYLCLEVATEVLTDGLPRRAGVGLLTAPGVSVGRCSAGLDACVLELPDPEGTLVSRLAAGAGGAGGELVVLTGAGGGVGVSTLTLSLARALVEQGRSVLAVDLDELGGGLDLAAGAESEPGWRWPDLAAASGQLGDIRAHLPVAEGVPVLAMPRGSGTDVPGPAALAAVVSSARRWSEVCLLDASGGGEVLAREVWSQASRCWLLVRAELQGLAAGRRRRERLTGAGLRVELVVVGGAGAGVGTAAVQRAVGAPVVAVVPDDRRLRTDVHRGARALSSGSRRWRRAVRSLAERVAS